MPRISALNQQWLSSPQYAQTQQQAMMQQQRVQQAALCQGTATTTGPSMWFTNSNSGGTGTLTVSIPVATSIATTVSSALYNTQHLMNVWDNNLVRDTLRLMEDCVVEDGVSCNVHLPDGSVLRVTKDGSFTIDDKDAKVTYRANRVRDFNPFVNASDKLEGFIKFCGALGVKQDEMLNLPVSLFIKWLIVMAAVADGEEADEAELLASVKRRAPRCTCGRYLARERVRRKVFFCRPVCMERRLAA